MRDLYVRLDGHDERTVRYGEEARFEVAPGRHRVTVTNRLYSKSISVDLSAGETARFEGANVATKGLLALVMIIGGGLAYRVDLRRID